jgi:alanyl-tRNA synthetase
MNAKQIRATFLEFFKNKGHEIVPSAPMVIKNDPTLMFNNSGMAPFKDIFLGNAPIKYTRIADTQKCLRVSGKHNDLEDVGKDTYHHTMFEMLGNWSFGDYFKKEAITWAWELLTDVYKIDKDKIYVTVFEGSEADGVPFDQEAYDTWKQLIAEDRILMGNKKDNFWEMGDAGPCGPCSEIHVDIRPDHEKKLVNGKDLVNNDHPQVIEIWNNVFMEFNRKWKSDEHRKEFAEWEKNAKQDEIKTSRGAKHTDATVLDPLPAKHVDTGMGFERLCMVLQGKTSNYDTDVFSPIIYKIEELSGHIYGKDPKTDIAIRVIADHLRAVGIAIADGLLPSNNGSGYVIRRILRRAIRYGYSFLGLKKPFMNILVEELDGTLGDTFPEIHAQKEFIAKVMLEEENSFLRTLELGLARLQDITTHLTGTEIPGAQAFELYDTFGFPYDLTSLIAQEQGLTMDKKGFDENLLAQKERSKSAGKITADNWVELFSIPKVEFLGYDEVMTESRITKYRKVNQKGKDVFQIVLDKTPFYAESGGQVGDQGFIQSANEKIWIKDTVKENELIIHIVDQLPENPTVAFTAHIDEKGRQLTTNNHSATHLLHAALRKLLGTHVEQRGSLVNADYLRFDFSHHSKISEAELGKIEQLVNQKIRENIRLDEKRNVPFKEATAHGAMALFGEKYGEFVRVITFDKNYSVELCGGCHVPATGNIGLFKIISESSVAAGVRRIEAITADKAEEFMNAELGLLDQLKEVLKNTKDPVKGAENLIRENDQLKKELEKFKLAETKQVKADLKTRIKTLDGVNILVEKVELDNDAIKNIAYELRGELTNLFLVLGNVQGDKAGLTVMLSDSLVEKGMNAKNIVNQLAKEIQGGGGGQPFFATAGGKSAAGIHKALELAHTLVG